MPDETDDLAHALGFETENALCRLAKIKPITAENWRKRGLGPDYVRIGNAVLYPRAALARYLEARTRPTRGSNPAAEAL